MNTAGWSIQYFWNTPYDQVQKLQKESVDIVRQNPEKKILLVGSHPHCFTMGRGLQKKEGKVLEELIEFDEQSAKDQFPEWDFFMSSRAGGMTFHHPNQIVIYPILNLNKIHHSLAKIMFLLFEAAKQSVQKLFQLRNQAFLNQVDIEIRREPFGLWCDHRKVASIGMALDHFVTCHGLAMNLDFDTKVQTMLQQNYPCGLPGNLYGSLADYINISEDEKETLSLNMIQLFKQSIDGK